MEKEIFTTKEKELIFKEVKNYLAFLNKYEKNNVNEIAETKEFIKDFYILQDYKITEFMYNLHFEFEHWTETEMLNEGIDAAQTNIIRKVCDYVDYKFQ